MIIDETGGPHGVRDYHALLSLEALARQKSFGKELYPTIFLKAALYARNICMNHPFVDGNKRTGITAALVFLESNGYVCAAKQGEVERFALNIVNRKLDFEEIAKWLQAHSSKG